MNIKYSEKFIVIDFGKNYFLLKSCDQEENNSQKRSRSRDENNSEKRSHSREQFYENNDFLIIDNIYEIKLYVQKHCQKHDFSSVKNMLIHFVNNCYFKSGLFNSRANYLENVIEEYKIYINEDDVYEYILSFKNFSVHEVIFLFNILTICYENFDNFWKQFLRI